MQSSFWNEAWSINTFYLSVETFCLPIRREARNMLLYYMESTVNFGLMLSGKCWFFRCLYNRNNKASTWKAIGFFLAKLHTNGLFQQPKEGGKEQEYGPQGTGAAILPAWYDDPKWVAAQRLVKWTLCLWVIKALPGLGELSSPGVVRIFCLQGAKCWDAYTTTWAAIL